MGADGWLGIGWPKEFGGQGAPGHRAVHLLRRGPARRLPHPVPHALHRRPDADEVRHRRAEGAVPARRSCAASCTSRSATASRARAPTSPSLRDARRARRRRLRRRTARRSSRASPSTPTTSGSPCAPIPRRRKHKGISILMVDTKAPGLLALADPHARRQPHQRHLLRGRARPASRCASAARTRAGSSSRRSSTTSASRCSRPARSTRFVEETTAWARETRPPTAARHRRALGAGRTSRGRARTSRCCALLTWRQAWNIDQGKLDPAESSTVKVFGSESFVEIYQLLLEVLGQAGYLKDGSPGALPARPHRALLPHHARAHVRRRRQRGAARHHRHGRARDAARAALTEERRHGLLVHRSADRRRGARAEDLRRARRRPRR